jgi:hypothetical protein
MPIGAIVVIAIFGILWGIRIWWYYRLLNYPIKAIRRKWQPPSKEGIANDQIYLSRLSSIV